MWCLKYFPIDDQCGNSAKNEIYHLSNLENMDILIQGVTDSMASCRISENCIALGFMPHVLTNITIKTLCGNFTFPQKFRFFMQNSWINEHFWFTENPKILLKVVSKVFSHRWPRWKLCQIRDTPFVNFVTKNEDFWKTWIFLDRG